MHTWLLRLILKPTIETVARRRYSKRYNIRRMGEAPSATLLQAWVKKLREEEVDTNFKHPRQQKTIRTPLGIESVRHAVNRNPRRSLRKHAQTLNLSRASIPSILKDLSFHPYRIHFCQYLKVIT